MKEYEHLALSESGFLFDSVNGNSFTLNRTGAFILRKLMEGISVDEVVSCVLERFDVPEETARKDAQQFIHHLREIRLLPRTNGQ